MALDPTLTRKMRDMLSIAPDEWKPLPLSCNDHRVVGLEKRGLIEVRVDPGKTATEVVIATHLGQFDHWQWRKIMTTIPQPV